MDELDLIRNTEFYSSAFRLLGKHRAHVYAGSYNSVISCPGAQHLSRTAAEVEYLGSRFQAQRSAKCGQFFWGDRVMDAMSTFSDVEYPWDVHYEKTV